MITKLEMAKVIVTALYNLEEMVSEKKPVLWRHVKKIVRARKDLIINQYKSAIKVIKQRIPEREHLKKILPSNS